jgi:hypothetical protein
VNYIDPNGMWKQHIDPWGGGFGDGGNGGGGTGGSGGIFGNGRRKCKYPDNTGNWLDKLKSEWNYDGVGYDPSYEPSYNNSRGTTGLNGSGGTGESTESVGGVSAGGGGNSVAIPETPQQDPNISLPNPKENDGMNPNGGLPSPIDLGMDDEDIISAILYHFAYYKKNNPHPYHLSDVIVPNSEHSVGNKTADDFKKFWGSFQGHFDGEADFNGVRITWWIGFGYNYESDYLNGIGQKTMDMGSNRQDGYKIFLYNQNNSDPRVMIVIYDWEYYKYINKLIGYE